MSDQAKHKIAEGIKRLGNSKEHGINIETITPAFVKSVTDDNEVTCEVDGLAVHNVRLKTLETGANKSMIIVPANESWVLIGCIEDTEEFVVLSVETAKKVIADIGGTTFQMDQDGIKLNGDQHAGLVKVGALKSKLNTLESQFNQLKAIFTAWVPVTQDGGAVLKSAVTSWASSNVATTQQSQIENTKVKHG